MNVMINFITHQLIDKQIKQSQHQWINNNVCQFKFKYRNQLIIYTNIFKSHQQSSFKFTHQYMKPQSSQILTGIKHQISENLNAFKKNKQNINIHVNTIKPLRSNADLNNIKQCVQSSIKFMATTKRNSSQASECLIKQLKLLLQQSWTKNEFLVRDRAEILKENFQLKQTIEGLTKSLQQAKQTIGELKLNGYGGNSVNGVFENGEIFKIGYEYNSRLVSEKENYSIQGRESLNLANRGRNGSSLNNSQQYPITNDNNNKHKYSPSQFSRNSNQQSLLIRQVSAEFLPTITNPNPGYSPTPQSYPSSQINQTPNYNFRNDLQQQKINPLKNHYVDIGSQFISYNNSCNNSGYGNSSKSQEYSRVMVNQGNQQAEISMNNIGNQLYLPINKDKPCLKQEIQTFKQHLYLVNNSNQQSLKHSQQHLQLRLPLNNQNQFQHHSQNQQQSNCQNTQFIYCSSLCEQGIFRSFYLSIIKYPFFREKFFQNLQELIHDDTFCLFSLYPKNEFWIEMVASFLQWIDVQKPSHEEVLKHINTHKLIDLLLIQALKYRVQFLFNELDANNEELNESSLLNGSVNCSHNFINTNPQLMTNRESVNCSFQHTSQQNSKFLQFFTALCNDFSLQCKKDEKAFYFYQSDSQSNNSRVSNQQTRPLFIIVNMQQMNAFGFEFSLYFEKSQINGSRLQMSNKTQRQIRRSHQMNEYSNSVKKNFRDIEINEPVSQEKSSQNSNLLKSYDNSSDGKYIDERSFVSQTNQYEGEEDYEEEYENSQEISHDNSQALSYIANTNLHKFNCTTRNITEMMMNSSNDNTIRSLRVSNQGAYDLNNSTGRQLRQRPIAYNNTMSFNYPIHEELIQTQSKQQLYSSFGKSGKSNNISNLSSLLTSPHVSNNASKLINEKKQNNLINAQKSFNPKGNQRYAKEQVQDQNFILKQVKSCQSEESDGVINDYEEEDEYEENAEPWKFNLKLR